MRLTILFGRRQRQCLRELCTSIVVIVHAAVLAFIQPLAAQEASGPDQEPITTEPPVDVGPDIDSGRMGLKAGEEELGVYFPDTVWTFNKNEKRRISVCWADDVSAYASEISWVQQSIAETWEKASAIKFTNWRRCTEQMRAVPIRVIDDRDGPRVRGKGNQLRASGKLLLEPRRYYVVLNFTFRNFGWPGYDCKGADREKCIRSSAVHEFGHVLSLAHEQVHTTAPEECKKAHPERKVGRSNVTEKFDPDSVMNYCRNNRMDALQLSVLDAKSVSALYCGRCWKTQAISPPHLQALSPSEFVSASAKLCKGKDQFGLEFERDEGEAILDCDVFTTSTPLVK